MPGFVGLLCAGRHNTAEHNIATLHKAPHNQHPGHDGKNVGARPRKVQTPTPPEDTKTPVCDIGAPEQPEQEDCITTTQSAETQSRREAGCQQKHSRNGQCKPGERRGAWCGACNIPYKTTRS